MTLFKWSRIAANNGTADSTCPFPEGMAPSAVNDGTRGMMAAVGKYRDDIAGAIVTGGTLNAYTVASYEGFGSLATDLNGQLIAFSPHVTNGDTVTLNVDGLGAKPLRSGPGVELLAGTLIAGTPYCAIYNHADLAFYLRGYFSSPFNIPFLGGVDYWDTISPGSAFIFPFGQAISRTVYARAFARWGTTFGAGDGSTTFNVPDKTGRVSVMKEAAAARLTVAGSGINGATFGAAGGAQNKTLVTANLPAYTPTGPLSVTANNFSASSATDSTPISVSGAGTGLTVPLGTSNIGKQVSTGTFSGDAQGGASAAFATVPPLIVCNYILRII